MKMRDRWRAERSVAVVAVLVVCALASRADDATTAEDPGFATCAAYFFLAARGHGMRDYDRLYSSGEHSLNLAAKRHGREAATAKMGIASNTMMAAMHQDWREIATIDLRYASACEGLLRDVDFRYD